MKKIVFLGCENSHSKQFLTYIKEDKKKYKDIEVVGCHSIEEKPKLELAKEFGIKALNNYSEAANEVDGVLITARDGMYHLELARPFIKKGMTIYVDKPITSSAKEAIELVKLAKENDVKLVGGSSLPMDENVMELKKINESMPSFGGFVRAPISLVNNYGGFYFYAEHLVDMALSIFGYYPNSVVAKKFKDHISFTLKYDNYDVFCVFSNDSYKYSAGVFNKDGSYLKEIPVTGGERCFQDHFDEFVMTMNKDKNDTDYKKFIAPVFVLNAIEKSMNKKKEVKVRRFDI